MNDKWPPEGWTIVTRESPHGKKEYFARNIKTGKEGPLRKTYAAALDDIQKKTYAEPWGV